jgi:hypothetical protein
MATLPACAHVDRRVHVEAIAVPRSRDDRTAIGAAVAIFHCAETPTDAYLGAVLGKEHVVVLAALVPEASSEGSSPTSSTSSSGRGAS